MKFSYLLVLFLSFQTLLVAQQAANPYAAVDKIARSIPDSVTHTSQEIANYISAHFTKSNDKARAIFIWVTKNIQYDLDNMFAINFYQNSAAIVDTALKKRTGVCMHFAELFVDIATKAGIKSYVVEGYTKQKGFVDYFPHAWCAAYIDSAWRLFDPTWGSGSVINKKFIKQYNNYYFEIKPEQLVKSHIPFDPMWEFLYYPVTNKDFYDGKTVIDKQKPYFNYVDTLKEYETQSELVQLINSSRRIQNNGVNNSMIFEKLDHDKRQIEYFANKKKADSYNAQAALFNAALLQYNVGVDLMNTYIDYKNHQFTPSKSEKETRLMIDTVETCFAFATQKLSIIKSSDSTMTLQIKQLCRSIIDNGAKVTDEEKFVDKYYNTSKFNRKQLFYTRVR